MSDVPILFDVFNLSHLICIYVGTLYSPTLGFHGLFVVYFGLLFETEILSRYRTVSRRPKLHLPILLPLPFWSKHYSMFVAWHHCLILGFGFERGLTWKARRWRREDGPRFGTFRSMICVVSRSISRCSLATICFGILENRLLLWKDFVCILVVFGLGVRCVMPR